MAIHIDPKNPIPTVTTRCGYPVILFCYFKKQQRSYLGCFYSRDTWVACSWNKDGTYVGEDQVTDMDLVTIKDLVKD